MQKNSITNKITPCCGLPFSVMYWWLTNLTLNTEADRQYIISKLSQNGILRVDAWKVLINSGTLEADASLTKAEFLAWFDCNKQPNCEQLKLIIEGFKVGNWNPNNEIPENISQIIEEQVSSQIGAVTGASKTYHEEIDGDKVYHVFDGWKKDDGTLIDYQQSEIGKYIADGGFTAVKTDAINFNPSFITREYQSDNLFDKTVFVDNKFFSYADVNYTYVQIATDANGWYISDEIPVTAGKYYFANASFGFFDIDDKLIAAFPISNVNSQIAPPTAVSARITGQKVNLDSIYFAEEKQDFKYSSLKLESGEKKISKKLLPPSVLSRKGNNLMVSVRGGGDFRWINDALDWLRNSGENDIFNPFTFEIIDGEYVESVNMIGLYLSLIGRNRENCIIKTYTNDYYYPPIDMAGNNHLQNLTIIADDNGTTTPANGVNNMPAYGIHFDVASRYENLGAKVKGRSIVKNCRVLAKNQHAVGQGLWTDEYSEWEDCEFYAPNTTAFRTHSYLPAGATNQQFLMRNCRVWNKGTHPPIVVQDANLAGGNDSTDTVYTFQENTFWNDNGANAGNTLLWTHDLVGAGTLSGKIKLGKGSFGNNIPKLNF